ncbi:MAG: Fmu (Sun) domain protein [Bacteroidetes bacterium]|nr:MAG: Fmu (Sun) domain protein [Bacteroidota bacterium]
MFDFYKRRPQLDAIYDAFEATLVKNIPADRALQFVMKKNRSWMERDRAWVADVFYDMIRRWRLLATAAGTGDRIDKTIFWQLFGTWLLYKHYNLPAEGVFERVNVKRIEDKLEQYKKIRAIWHSIPDWLDRRGEKETGENWTAILEASNKPAPLFIRVNTLRVTKPDLYLRMRDEGFMAEDTPDGWDALLMKGGNVFRSKAFKEGLFEVQDLSSQLVAPFVEAEPGMRVIDACAGAGGKTMHLATFMKNKGRLLALDVSESKLEELRIRAKRAGAGIVEAKHIDSGKVIKRLAATADRLLIDAPCSGTGVLRRNPDIRWRLEEEDIVHLQQQQDDLLERYSAMVKPGGKMVYAVCSVFSSEGEERIRAFVQRHAEVWTLEEEKRAGLIQHAGDGFYMARLCRAK